MHAANPQIEGHCGIAQVVIGAAVVEPEITRANAVAANNDDGAGEIIHIAAAVSVSTGGKCQSAGVQIGDQHRSGSLPGSISSRAHAGGIHYAVAIEHQHVPDDAARGEAQRGAVVGDSRGVQSRNLWQSCGSRGHG